MTTNEFERARALALAHHQSRVEGAGRLKNALCSVVLPVMLLLGFSLLFFGTVAGVFFTFFVIISCFIARNSMDTRRVQEESVRGEGVAGSDERPNLDKLVISRYEAPDGSGSDVQCEICLEEFQTGDLLASSPNLFCIHAFHKDCIIPALLVNPTYPCCRRDYLKTTEEGEVEVIADVENQFNREENARLHPQEDSPIIGAATSEVDAATVEAIVGVLEHEPVLPIIIVTNIELCRREHV